MPLDRSSAAKDATILDRLITRKKWAKAIKLLRKQILEGETPSVQGRLQLVDLMVLDGRGRETVPILLGLADEFAGYGFIAKSIAILKRVEKLDPDRADVAERFSALASEQARLAADAIAPTRTEPLFREGRAVDERTTLSSEESPADTARLSTPEIPPQSVSENGDLSLEQLIQRLSPNQTLPTTPPAAFDLKTTAAALSDKSDLLVEELIRRLSPDDTLPPLPLATLDLDILQEAAAALPAPELIELELESMPEVESLSDEAFHQQILDLVADVLHSPTKPTSGKQAPVQDSVLASRLLATPLLGSLSADELLAVVRGLDLRTYDPGDALVTEGESSRSLFILMSGRAKVFVRSLDGHAVEVDELLEGDFFGEIAVLSGVRRAATVTAATACEVLELDKETLDSIARTQPNVRETLEAAYVRRVGNPDSMAVRSVALGTRELPRRAIAILESHFGESEWRPRMRLRLADVLLKSGKPDAAVPILARLAEELAHSGYPAKAIALVKKIEMIQRRHVEEIPLAPLTPSSGEDDSLKTQSVEDTPPAKRQPSESSPVFEKWLVRLAREAVEKRRGQRSDLPAPSSMPPRGYAPGLRASPLFENIDESEFLALVQGLKLMSYQAGDIIVSEGEPGESVYVLASGSAKVLVRESHGRGVPACRLVEGEFFGEMAALSGRPRSATVIASTPCDLLELDKQALDEITSRYPRVREVLETVYVERATDPNTERIRTAEP